MVRLFVTGGTIDVDHVAPDGSYCFEKSFLPQMLSQARSGAAIEVETLFLKDSLHMVEVDRTTIVEACRGCAEDRVLVTHGTDSMAATAHALGIASIAKTIVLLGAAVPYTKPGSDALFNLGFALGVVQHLPPGVFVAMNGQVFAWHNVQKNRSTGFFQNIR